MTAKLQNKSVDLNRQSDVVENSSHRKIILTRSSTGWG